MDTVNGLNAAQVRELLLDLQDGDHIKKEKSGKLRLRHEYIRARLTQIFGFNGWGEQNLKAWEVHRSTDRTGETVVAYGAQQRLILRNDDGSVRNFFDGTGAWGLAGKGIPVWEMHSDAMNGACSVALCRAVMNLGPQFGLSLYAEDPATAVVGYSLPHQPLSHLYGAKDADDGTPDEGSMQYTEDPDKEDEHEAP